MKRYINYFNKASLVYSILTIVFMIVVQNAIIFNTVLLIKRMLLVDVKLIGYVLPNICTIAENRKLNIVMRSL